MPALISREPAFDVRISTVLRKSALRPDVVGEGGVIHHLQQDVVDVFMGLFDLVEQDDAVWMRAHGIDELPALFEADVARRRADQPRDRVLFHVFAHVEADELVAEQQRQLLGELRLADAGGTGEQEAAGGPLWQREARARTFDRLGHEMHGFRLAKDDPLERLLKRAQPLAIG